MEDDKYRVGRSEGTGYGLRCAPDTPPPPASTERGISVEEPHALPLGQSPTIESHFEYKKL